MKKHCILYVPGLGDNYDPLRRFFLKSWRVFGVQTQLAPMSWRDGRSYENKLQQLGEVIADKYHQGYKITLLGESAGGSMVLNAYAKYGDMIFRAMTICGKNTAPRTVSSKIYSKNPSFKTSMHQTPKSVEQLTKQERQRFISVHPVHDGYVPVNQTLIPDCQQVCLWSGGHLTTIFLALSLFSPIMVRTAIKK